MLVAFFSNSLGVRSFFVPKCLDFYRGQQFNKVNKCGRVLSCFSRKAPKSLKNAKRTICKQSLKRKSIQKNKENKEIAVLNV